MQRGYQKLNELAKRVKTVAVPVFVYVQSKDASYKKYRN